MGYDQAARSGFVFFFLNRMCVNCVLTECLFSMKSAKQRQHSGERAGSSAASHWIRCWHCTGQEGGVSGRLLRQASGALLDHVMGTESPWNLI